jgi:hypothetical protein
MRAKKRYSHHKNSGNGFGYMQTAQLYAGLFIVLNERLSGCAAL